MPSMDLVPSAADLGDSFLEQGAKRIESARVTKLIEAHYYARAKKLYKKLWRQCGRRTGHDFSEESSSMYSPYTRYVCAHCGKPSGHDKKNRTKRGINALADKLRSADKAAGIEWTG